MNDSDSSQSRGTGSSKRIMALDLGEKRIGVAVSDGTRTIARSLATIGRTSRTSDYEQIGRIASEQGISLIVVGLPLLSSGQEGEKAAWVRDYVSDLQRHIALPVEFWDESNTTVQAEASLRERGIHGKRRRQRVDAAAAAFILQAFLDAQTDGTDKEERTA